MDERLKKALDFANFRVSLQNQKETLKLKLKEHLTYSTNGGTFSINPELISFVAILKERSEEGILLDQNEIPIHIENLEDFLDEILSRYMNATNNYYDEYEKLKKSRNVGKVVNW